MNHITHHTQSRGKPRGSSIRSCSSLVLTIHSSVPFVGDLELLEWLSLLFLWFSLFTPLFNLLEMQSYLELFEMLFLLFLLFSLFATLFTVLQIQSFLAGCSYYSGCLLCGRFKLVLVISLINTNNCAGDFELFERLLFLLFL